MKDIYVVLGTAHLESTPGKRSPDGKFREYKYSRRVCEELKNRLRKDGVHCDIDCMLDDMAGVNSSEELIRRVHIVNDEYCDKYGKDRVIYVSIHVNASASSDWDTATGFSIYTSPGQTESDVLATYIYNTAEQTLKPLKKRLIKDMSDGDPDLEANFYVLRKTKCPAVLTENFFQNNKDDVAWLESDEGFDTVVEYHRKGILSYLNS